MAGSGETSDLGASIIALTMTLRRILWLIVIAWVLTAASLAETNRSVRDGVYSAEQASRGEVSYGAKCSACHGEDLSGYRGILRGAAFNEEFQGESLKTLFTVIKRTMPRDAPSSLSDETYLDIVAYVLKMNGYPGGSGTLSTANLDSIQVVAQPGAEEIANYSMVRVIGCMTAGAGGTWTLTRATAPVKTRNPDASAPAELKRFESTPLGNGTFTLVDTATVKTETLKTHKVEAKGFLMRHAGGDGLSLTSLQSVSNDCK